MIRDIQSHLGDVDWTNALLHILSDWEKFRYLPEKQRLVELAKLRFYVFEKQGDVTSNDRPA